MNYDYYKRKYKTISIKLDRVQDADIISFLERSERGIKDIITGLIRLYIKEVTRK